MPRSEGGRAQGSHAVLLGQVWASYIVYIIHLTWIYRDIYPIIFRILKTDMHESDIKFVPSSTYTVPTTRETELSPQLVGIGASEPRGHGNHTR